MASYLLNEDNNNLLQEDGSKFILDEEFFRITFIKHGGIYYTDKIDFPLDGRIIILGKIIFTDDINLIGMTIDQMLASNVRPEIILIRDVI
ncbi:MAG: hypothetical protein ACYDIA_01685 [Candidatus Humimicrobiaceae bacterium]